MQASYWRYSTPTILSIISDECPGHSHGIWPFARAILISMIIGQRIWPFVCSRHLAICMTLPLILFLFFRLRMSGAIAHFLPARRHLCIYIASNFTPDRCRLGVGSYLALRHEYACRGLYLHAALVLKQFNHDSLHCLTMLVI